MNADEKKNEMALFCIWVDADACPRDARELVIRAALRRNVRTVFVANSPQFVPDRDCLEFRLVPSGADKADDLIVEEAGGLDMVITADIPLAARLVEKQVMVLNPRGEEWTEANIGERLAMRNLMEELRSAGIPTGGPKEYGQADRQNFANALDRVVSKRLRG